MGVKRAEILIGVFVSVLKNSTWTDANRKALGESSYVYDGKVCSLSITSRSEFISNETHKHEDIST